MALGIRLSDVDRLLTTLRGQANATVQDVATTKVESTNTVIASTAGWALVLLLTWGLIAKE